MNQHVSFAPHVGANSLGGMVAERPMEAYEVSKAVPRATALHGQEELQRSLDALQTIIIDGVLRRLSPVLNEDPQSILQDMERYMSAGHTVKDTAERGQSEINRRCAQQTQQVTILNVILNSLLEKLDLP